MEGALTHYIRRSDKTAVGHTLKVEAGHVRVLQLGASAVQLDRLSLCGVRALISKVYCSLVYHTKSHRASAVSAIAATVEFRSPLTVSSLRYGRH